MSFLSWLIDSKNYEEEAKELYFMGFCDGRLCPTIRQCVVDGKTCRFHRWIDEDKTLLKINCFVSAYEQERLLRNFREEAVMPMGTSAEIVRHTYALVEFPDGSVGKVEPECVCFMDREGLDHE